LAAPGLEIRDLRAGDWPEVAAIYADGIRTRNATFETVVPAWEEWDAAHLPRHRLVAIEGDVVVGWAALAPASARACYAGVAEASVYVGRGRQGRGIGRALLERLVRDAEAVGFWTIQTSIFPENRASLALHLRCGFRVVGVRERIARLEGVWRDTLLLERRAGAVPSQSPTHPGDDTLRVAAESARDCVDFAPIWSGAA
jgi:L-amino acid N-acyltransferase YncA